MMENPAPNAMPAYPDARSYAASLLSLYLLRASMEPDVQASYEKQKHLKELGLRLVDRMNAPEDYPNKSYNGLAEAVTLSIILYDYYPDAYAQMMSGIAQGEMEVFLDSFEGMRRFDMMIHGLADDHDYVFSHTRNRIENSGPENRGEHGVYPAAFLARVREAIIAGENHQQSPAENDAPGI